MWNGSLYKKKLLNKIIYFTPCLHWVGYYVDSAIRSSNKINGGDAFDKLME